MMYHHQLYLSIAILLVHLLTYVHSTDNAQNTLQNRSNWWKEVHSNVTDYVPSHTVRSLINSTISGNEYWHSGANGQRSNSNHSETYNELVRPDTSIVLPGRSSNAKIVRKIKRTFKNRTGKQQGEQPSEEPANEWKENIVEPPLERNLPVDPDLPLHRNTPTTTSSPVTLAKASTSNHFQTTASDIDSLITSKVKWDDENELQPPLSRSPIFKAKINNQENIYEKYASIMPLPPPNTSQQPTTMPIESNEVNSNNNLQSSSHHSIVAPLSSANSNYFNFNSKVVHTLPASRSSDKNQRKKQAKQTRNAASSSRAKAPIQDFFLEAEKVEKKADDHQANRQVNAKRTVDFTSRVNHEVTPNNNLLAHLLKNNPFAIPIGKKTYKVTKKATTASTPGLPPTVLTKRMNSPLKYATGSTGSDSISSRGSEEYSTTPMSTLTNDNLDNINFKAKPSTQDYTWGRRVQASNNLISKTNTKANQLAKRNEWSGNDEQKDSINDKLIEHTNESDEESVENEENTNEDTEPVNGEDLNNEFNKNLAAIRNEESPKFDVVTFKPTVKENNQVKGQLNVKSLPIQIISWRQAINHRKKSKDDDKSKPFAGERITSAKLVVRKDQQIEREKPSPKAFSKQTTKQPPSTTSAKTNTFKTTTSPKLITTTKSAYQSNSVDTTAVKRTTPAGKSTRSPMNAFGMNRKMPPKNEAYVAPQTTTKTKPAVSAQLFQEYEDEKENFREELDDNYVKVDLRSSPKKENRVKYAKNQEFRKKSLNLIEEKNDNSLENNDQTEATKPIPVTGFKCQDQGLPGYYGDVETGCTVFHICQENNRKDSFFCPPGTAFNQQLLVCDWAANINCEAGSRKPNPNANVFNNNNYESSNTLRNNNYEVEDGLEEQKK